MAPPPPLRYPPKIGKPIFGPADIGGHRRTLADIPPDLGARQKTFGIVKNCFVLHRITRCLDIVPNTRSIGKVFLIDFRPAAQGIFRLAALYKVLDDIGHLETRNRSSILFPDRQPHLPALYIFLDLLQHVSWILCNFCCDVPTPQPKPLLSESGFNLIVQT